VRSDVTETWPFQSLTRSKYNLKWSDDRSDCPGGFAEPIKLGSKDFAADLISFPSLEIVITSDNGSA
jgi:hypothetical protein